MDMSKLTFFIIETGKKYSIQRALKILKIKLTYLYFALCLKDQKSEVVLIERTSIEIKSSHTNNECLLLFSSYLVATTKSLPPGTTKDYESNPPN